MSTLHVVRVFTDPGGEFGNPLGVFLRGGEVPEHRRLSVAADLGYSETVFVDDIERARLRIFTPTGELPLAGHPLVGTAWVLAYAGSPASVLRPPAGDVPTWTDGEVTWFRADRDSAPPWQLCQLDDAGTVAGMRSPPGEEHDFTQFWAWQDRASGSIRARVFAPRVGVPEDEATGSAAMCLAHQLRQAIVIHQGEGSVIHARPGSPEGTVEVGGRTVLDEIRDYQPH